MRRKTMGAGLTWVVIPLTTFLLGITGCNNEVHFGAVLPLSGDGELYGRSIQRGIEMAYEELSAGDVHRYQMSLRIEDSQSDAQRAQQLAAGLYEEAIAVIGGVSDAEALSIVDTADERGKVLLSPSSSSPRLSSCSSQFYRIFPDARTESIAMAQFVTAKLGSREASILAVDGDYGTAAAETFGEVFRGDVTASVTFPAGDPDALAAAVRELLKGQPKVVLVAARGDDLAQAIRQLRRHGFRGSGRNLLATSALASPTVRKTAGRSSVEGVYYTQTFFDPTSEQEPMRSFAAAYESKYGEPPDLYAAYGYDAMRVLATALEEGGGNSPSQLRKGMRSINGYDGVTGSIQFRESGDVQKFARVYAVKEGRVVDFLTWEQEVRARIELLRDAQRKAYREAQSRARSDARERERDEARLKALHEALGGVKETPAKHP